MSFRLYVQLDESHVYPGPKQHARQFGMCRPYHTEERSVHRTPAVYIALYGGLCVRVRT
jgi:hypothetical protein